jgi:tRNA threonylcarbamoyladenosine biosynthesis protein TsaB
MLLAIDTTSAPGSLAFIGADGTCVAQAGDERPHGEQLPGAALDLLSRQGCTLADIDVFAVATGPGSLTGLRVGMATVQGLGVATGRPCVGVSVFEALSWAWVSGTARPAAGDLLGVWLDARRTSTPLDGRRALRDLVESLEGPTVGTAPERIAAWRAVRAEEAGRLALCGTRVEADREALATLGPHDIIDLPSGLAAAVAAVAAREAAHGRTVTPHALHPLYVRRPDVETARERARAASPR